MSAHLANIFGRRSILLACILLFALGSALCGGAQSMNMLIGGRGKFHVLETIVDGCLIWNLSAVQGAGAGGILALTEIILSDLVPLKERGMYQGMIGSVWSIACTLGPPVVSSSRSLVVNLFQRYCTGGGLSFKERLDMARVVL